MYMYGGIQKSESISKNATAEDEAPFRVCFLSRFLPHIGVSTFYSSSPSPLAYSLGININVKLVNFIIFIMNLYVSVKLLRDNIHC